MFGHWQEENLLLNVRRQLQQVHDLADTSAADVPQAGHGSVRRQDALANEAVEFDGQGQEAGHARHATGWQRRLTRRGTGSQIAAPTLAASNVDLMRKDERRGHGVSS